MKWCSLRSPDPRTLDHSTVCLGYSEDQSHSNANHNSPLQSWPQQSWTRGSAAPWALSGGQHQSGGTFVRMHCLHMYLMWSRVIAMGDMVRLSGRVCAGFSAVWWVWVISLARWFPHHGISCSFLDSPYIYTHTHIYIDINLYIYKCVCVCIRMAWLHSLQRSVYLSICLFLSLSHSLSVCPSLSLSI